MSSASSSPPEKTTDDEAVKAKTTPAQAKAYEKDVADYVASLDAGAVVTPDYKQVGVISGRVRQVDVLVEGSIGGVPIKVAVECKHYTNTIGIGMIDEFHGKLLDLGIPVGIFYSIGRLSAGAVARADGTSVPQIVRRQWAPTPIAQPTWAEVNERLIGKFGDCANEGCLLGDVDWSEWPAGAGNDPMVAGPCGSCGTWNYRCPHCGEEDSFDGSTMQCYSCGARWDVLRDKDGDLEGFTETSGPTTT